MGLLHARSRSQWRFKMLVNGCPDDIFWSTEHFVAKPGIFMQNHKQKCVQKYWFTVFNVKVTARTYIIKILLFLLYLLNCWSVCNQHYKPECPHLLKNGISAFKVKVKVTANVQNVSKCLSWWYFLCVSNHVHSVSPEPLNLFLILNLVLWYYHESTCHADKLVHYLQCQGHNEGLHNQNMINSDVVSSKQLAGLHPNFVL